jgi:sec-independent protein translocase protein TatA
MDNPEIWIGLVIVGFLIFGAKRMPDAARGLGRSLRIFKAETKGLLTDDDQKAAPAPPLQLPANAPVQAPVYAAPVQQAPVYAAPVQQAPVYAAPVQQQAPVYAAPVQQAPAAAPAPAEQQPVPEHRDAQ